MTEPQVLKRVYTTLKMKTRIIRQLDDPGIVCFTRGFCLFVFCYKNQLNFAEARLFLILRPFEAQIVLNLFLIF